MNEQDPIKRIRDICPDTDIAGEGCGFEVKVSTPAGLRQG